MAAPRRQSRHEPVELCHLERRAANSVLVPVRGLGPCQTRGLSNRIQASQNQTMAKDIWSEVAAASTATRNRDGALKLA